MVISWVCNCRLSYVLQNRIKISYCVLTYYNLKINIDIRLSVYTKSSSFDQSIPVSNILNISLHRLVFVDHSVHIDANNLFCALIFAACMKLTEINENYLGKVTNTIKNHIRMLTQKVIADPPLEIHYYIT